jgi:LytS/YehU family sensor histidine kinase
VVQPLVENAVRHGVARSKTPATIRISARKENDHEGLVLRVANEGPPWDPDQARNGIGVGNLRRRLQFREGASLTLMQEDGITVAEIRLGKESGHGL